MTKTTSDPNPWQALNESQSGAALTAPPIQVLIIQPDESHEVRVMDQSTADFRALIGGHPQDVVTEHATFWVHKECRPKGQPFNPFATWLWWKLAPEFEDIEQLQGTVIVTGSADEAGDSEPVLPEVVDLFERLARAIHAARTRANN